MVKDVVLGQNDRATFIASALVTILTAISLRANATILSKVMIVYLRRDYTTNVLPSLPHGTVTLQLRHLGGGTIRLSGSPLGGKGGRMG